MWGCTLALPACPCKPVPCLMATPYLGVSSSKSSKAPLPMSQLCRVCSYYTWLLPVEDNTVILTFSWVRSDCLSIDPVHWL